jgi:acetyltransferase-like isoleucine patch superfamily enzyme
VTIGDGAVIGAGSVVVADMPAYSVAVGNPARVLRKRFPDDTIAAFALGLHDVFV